MSFLARLRPALAALLAALLLDHVVASTPLSGAAAAEGVAVPSVRG